MPVKRAAFEVVEYYFVGDYKKNSRQEGHPVSALLVLSILLFKLRMNPEKLLSLILHTDKTAKTCALLLQ